MTSSVRGMDVKHPGASSGSRHRWGFSRCAGQALSAQQPAAWVVLFWGGATDNYIEGGLGARRHSTRTRSAMPEQARLVFTNPKTLDIIGPVTRATSS